jgi:NAD-dependent dihydropyrimidine dehydrogenase PreA subunit
MGAAATYRDFAACSGCSVCRLVCPMWRARRDPRYSAEGLAKAQQGGASAAELASVLAACTLCGACEPACPENIALVDMVAGLRDEIGPPPDLAVLQVGHAQAAADAAPPPPGALLLAGAALRADPALFERCSQLLGLAAAADDGADIALALEAGADVPAQRARGFLAVLDGRSLVVGDGLLLRWLRASLPGARLQGLGEALGHVAAIRRRIASADFYVIEPRAFHADHARLVVHYDSLRRETGCAMNLDLQRIAVPPRAEGYSALRMGWSAVDQAQAAWMLQGSRPARLLVENVAERELLRRVTGVPVLHLTELAEG